MTSVKESSLLFAGEMVRAIVREVDPKTQTRRALLPQPAAAAILPRHWSETLQRRKTPGIYGGDGTVLGNVPMADGTWGDVCCPYGLPGDRIYVKETFFAWGRWETRFSAKKGRDEWHFVDMTLEAGKAYLYAADGNGPATKKRQSSILPAWWKRPAIFMPRVASRILLEVTEVRVERLQDISEADARAEGVADGGCTSCGMPEPCGCPTPLPSARDAFAHLWMSINGPDSWAVNPSVWAVSFRRIAT